MTIPSGAGLPFNTKEDFCHDWWLSMETRCSNQQQVLDDISFCVPLDFCLCLRVYMYM